MLAPTFHHYDRFGEYWERREIQAQLDQDQSASKNVYYYLNVFLCNKTYKF